MRVYCGVVHRARPPFYFTKYTTKLEYFNMSGEEKHPPKDGKDVEERKPNLDQSRQNTSTTGDIGELNPILKKLLQSRAPNNTHGPLDDVTTGLANLIMDELSSGTSDQKKLNDTMELLIQRGTEIGIESLQTGALDATGPELLLMAQSTGLGANTMQEFLSSICQNLDVLATNDDMPSIAKFASEIRQQRTDNEIQGQQRPPAAPSPQRLTTSLPPGAAPSPQRLTTSLPPGAAPSPQRLTTSLPPYAAPSPQLLKASPPPGFSAPSPQLLKASPRIAPGPQLKMSAPGIAPLSPLLKSYPRVATEPEPELPTSAAPVVVPDPQLLKESPRAVASIVIGATDGDAPLEIAIEMDDSGQQEEYDDATSDGSSDQFGRLYADGFRVDDVEDYGNNMKRCDHIPLLETVMPSFYAYPIRRRIEMLKQKEVFDDAVEEMRVPPHLGSFLHAAAYESDVVSMQMTIESGVEVDAVDKYGRTALLSAVFDPPGRDFTSAVWLIEHDIARLDCTDRSGRTVFHYACLRAANEVLVAIRDFGPKSKYWDDPETDFANFIRQEDTHGRNGVELSMVVNALHRSLPRFVSAYYTQFYDDLQLPIVDVGDLAKYCPGQTIDNPDISIWRHIPYPDELFEDSLPPHNANYERTEDDEDDYLCNKLKAQRKPVVERKQYKNHLRRRKWCKIKKTVARGPPQSRKDILGFLWNGGIHHAGTIPRIMDETALTETPRMMSVTEPVAVPPTVTNSASRWKRK
eukprot:GHVH01004874.1.p1 GENE.GHVH01004874.1~~GHVH01004874.1.p1  ORF type:complete len:747 (+),score=89.87 GHVH01004874.1:246-2486(+)